MLQILEGGWEYISVDLDRWIHHCNTAPVMIATLHGQCCSVAKGWQSCSVASDVLQCCKGMTRYSRVLTLPLIMYLLWHFDLIIICEKSRVHTVVPIISQPSQWLQSQNVTHYCDGQKSSKFGWSTVRIYTNRLWPFWDIFDNFQRMLHFCYTVTSHLLHLLQWPKTWYRGRCYPYTSY